MEWNQSLATGIASVDEQHRRLFAAFDALDAAMREGKGSDEVLPTLRFLGEYALTHFGAEEALMALHGYPDLPAHRTQHEQFRADFGRLLRETQATPHRVAKTMAVSQRLLDWLYAHIGRVDRKMAAYLTGKGVT